MKLFVQPHNTASDSVRIALRLKDIPHDIETYDKLAALTQAMDHPLADQTHLGPVLLEEQRLHVESLAIIEYLDELYPDPPLLPGTARDRVRVRGIAQIVMSDVDPYIRASAINFRKEEGCGDVDSWSLQWINRGFDLLEAMLADNPATGRFCLGDSVTMADLCLTPLIWNAERLGLNLQRYPTVREVYDNCMRHPDIESVALDLN